MGLCGSGIWSKVKLDGGLVTSARQSFRALIYGPPKNKIGKI